MNKSYPFLLVTDGQKERFDVEAASVSEALFLLGLEFGLAHPRLIPNAHSFKIVKMWGNP